MLVEAWMLQKIIGKVTKFSIKKAVIIHKFG